MKSHQLTPEERYTISACRKAGLSIKQIAREISKHRSTIYREIKRHTRQNSYRPS